MIPILVVLLCWASERTGADRQPDPPAATTIPVRDAVPNQTAPERITAATRGVLGSKHDFSKVTGRTPDACGACHVPHVQTVRPGETAEEPFSLAFYRMGGQREVLVPDRYMPGPSSLICLSCHNGAVAASTVASSHVLLSVHRSGFSVDGFATRDHPIGIEYPAQRAGYRPRAQVLQSGVIPLPYNRMECISCHEPHNAAGVDKMLVMPNRRSALCLSCHEK